MPGYAALPSSAGRGMVVIHELLGRQPEVDRVVERLADAGFAAVEPDLFHGAGRLGCIRRALATISKGKGPMADKIFAARDWLCAEADPELVRLRAPKPGFGFDMWCLTHPDLRGTERVRAFMRHAGAYFDARKQLYAGKRSRR